jgi:triphosphoribosyl-dephospho-CoA synthetase
MHLKKELLEFLEANNNFGLIEGLVEGIVDTYISAYKECNKSLNEQTMSEQSAVEWLVNEISKSGIGNHTMIVHKKEIEQAKEMEKEQQEVLLNYIQEVRDLCVKLRFPTEEELRDLTNKADGILNQFKQQEQ